MALGTKAAQTTLKELQGMYGYTDESKEWLNMRKAHLQKWKIIKKQAAKAALRGRGGGGRSGRKQAFSWKFVANIQGEGLTLGGVWTRAEAQNHFGVDYKFDNDTPRGGNVSIKSEVFKRRKYFADSGDYMYVRIVEIEEGTEYTIEQGYPLGDGDGDDDEDDPSGAPSKAASEVDEEEAAQTAPSRVRKAAGAPAPAPVAASAAAPKEEAQGRSLAPAPFPHVHYALR
jgi:hypothetical protein